MELAYFFSPSTLGWYVNAIHGDDMPEDVVQVSSDLYEELRDKQIAAGPDGFPCEHSPPPAVPTAPRSVTMRQARLALLETGKLAAVNAAIVAMPSPERETAQIEWEFAATVERDSPFLQSLASVLGMDDAHLDQLFMLAASK